MRPHLLRASALRVDVLRVVVLIVCAGGIAGMIVASILDSNGAALTFGLVTAGAVTCLIAATAVGGEKPVDDAQAMAVEGLVRGLVEQGADEGAVRNLVKEASRLGRRKP